MKALEKRPTQEHDVGVEYLRSRVEISSFLSSIHLGYDNTSSYHVCHPTCIHRKPRNNIRVSKMERIQQNKPIFNSTPVACEVNCVELNVHAQSTKTYLSEGSYKSSKSLYGDRNKVVPKEPQAGRLDSEAKGERERHLSHRFISEVPTDKTLPRLEEIDDCVSILLSMANIDSLAPSIRTLLTTVGVIVTKSIFKKRCAIREVRIPTDMYSKEHETLEEELESRQKVLRDLQAEVSLLRNEGQSLREVTKERHVDVKNLQKLKDSLSKKLQNMNGKLRELRNTQADADYVHSDLQSQVRKYQVEYEKHNQKLFSLNQESKFIRQTIQAEQEQLDKLLSAKSDPRLVPVGTLKALQKQTAEKKLLYEKLLKIREFKEQAHIETVQRCSALEEECKAKHEELKLIQRKLKEQRRVCTPRPNWEELQKKLEHSVMVHTNEVPRLDKIPNPSLRESELVKSSRPNRDENSSYDSSEESDNEILTSSNDVAPSCLTTDKSPGMVSGDGSDSEDYEEDFESDEEETEVAARDKKEESSAVSRLEQPQNLESKRTAEPTSSSQLESKKQKELLPKTVSLLTTERSSPSRQVAKKNEKGAIEATMKQAIQFMTGDRTEYDTAFAASEALVLCTSGESTAGQVSGLVKVMRAHHLTGTGRAEIARLEKLLDRHHDNVFKLLEEQRLLLSKFPTAEIIIEEDDPYRNHESMMCKVEQSDGRGHFVRISDSVAGKLPHFLAIDGMVKVQAHCNQTTANLVSEVWQIWMQRYDSALKRLSVDTNQPVERSTSIKEVDLVQLMQGNSWLPPADVHICFAQFLKQKYGTQRQAAKSAFSLLYSLECYHRTDVRIGMFHATLTKAVPQGTYLHCLQMEHQLLKFLRKVSDLEKMESHDMILKSDLHAALRGFFPCKTKFEISQLLEAAEKEFKKSTSTLRISSLLHVGKGSHSLQFSNNPPSHSTQQQETPQASPSQTDALVFIQCVRRQYLEEVKRIWYDIRLKLGPLRSPNGNCKFADLVRVLQVLNSSASCITLEKNLCTGLKLSLSKVQSYLAEIEPARKKVKQKIGRSERIICLDTFVENISQGHLETQQLYAREPEVHLDSSQVTQLLFAGGSSSPRAQVGSSAKSKEQGNSKPSEMELRRKRTGIVSRTRKYVHSMTKSRLRMLKGQVHSVEERDQK